MKETQRKDRDAEIFRVSVRTHGRVFVQNAADHGRLLVAFHRYAQNAENMLDEVAQIPGASEWRIGSVQGLHRFSARDQRVVASWMTSQDRDDEIADNIEYVNQVVDTVLVGPPRLRISTPPRLVFI